MLKESVEMHAPAAVKESVEAAAKGMHFEGYRLVYDGMLKFHGFLK